MKKLTLLFVVTAILAVSTSLSAEPVSYGSLTAGVAYNGDEQGSTKVDESQIYPYMNVSANWQDAPKNGDIFSALVMMGFGYPLDPSLKFGTVKDFWAATVLKYKAIKVGNNYLAITAGVPMTTFGYRGVQPGIEGKWVPFNNGFYLTGSTYGSFPLLKNPFSSVLGDKFYEASFSASLGYSWAEDASVSVFGNLLANNEPSWFATKPYQVNDWSLGISLIPARSLEFRVSGGYDKWHVKQFDVIVPTPTYTAVPTLKMETKVSF